jgi:sensitive to high expression protein 9
MKPLLQQASRALTAGLDCLASSSRPSRGLLSVRPSTCLPCQYRTASTARRTNNKTPSTSPIPEIWLRRAFSSSRRGLEERKPSNGSQPIPMPPPTSEPQPASGGPVRERAPEHVPTVEERLEALLVKDTTGPKDQPGTQNTSDQLSAGEARQPSYEEPPSSSPKKDVGDTITRVPDDQLPSHRERQRWDFSKRLSELMDDVLPKLAVVTHKVNTYTGTDYSGVEALRREIKEQGVFHAPTACVCHY